MARFLEALSPSANSTILDVGGYPWIWLGVNPTSPVTVLNLHEVPPTPSQTHIKTVVGDGCRLEFNDGSFDIVYSNSVIEHLGTFERQQAFARECRRVGRKLWVQTPAKSFPVEPHLLTPLIHFLPRAWQRRLLRNFTVWGLIMRPTPREVADFMGEVRLLSYREMKELFPDCQIIRERVMGFTKSYVAVRRTGIRAHPEKAGALNANS